MARAATQCLMDVLSAQARGEPRGVYSVCTADSMAIKAALQQALEDGSPAIIEATSNQVNQFGGYTGMRPRDFVETVLQLAASVGFPAERVVLGGDHLGPHPWRDLPAEAAMKNACDLVAAFVSAGCSKLHLDASSALGDERVRGQLPKAIVAERTALLCEAAEAAYRERARTGSHVESPVYVIGSDVPPPGGRSGDDRDLPVTTPDEFEELIELSRDAFRKRNLGDAWKRVVAVVVNPGVEFEDWVVHEYDRQAAAPLTAALRRHEGLVFEAHSTDYQTPASLRQMVEDGFAILKVGPALTFAKREGLFLLACIEQELVGINGISRTSALVSTLDAVMVDNPRYWQPYYRGNGAELRLKREYSLLDRCRYYWSSPRIQNAVEGLIGNLRGAAIPLPLLSQYLPRQYQRVRSGELSENPEALLLDRIRDVLRGYAVAAGWALCQPTDRG